MIFSERNKIVNVEPAADQNAQTVATDIVSLKNYDHVTFILTFGAVDAATATTTNLIAYKGEDFSACNTAFACKYRACTVAEDTADCDTLGAVTALATTGVSIGTGNTIDVSDQTGGIVVVEIDAEDLAPTAANPYDTVRLGMVVNGNGCLMSAIAILSKPRYADAAGPTAVA